MICALVLAAGRSRRMGAQKLLLPLGGAPIIARIVDEILRSPADRVFVITGPDSQAIREALANRPVSFVANPHVESEMLDSVRCGLRALPEACAAVLVVLGDQPRVTADLIALLVRAFDAENRGLVLPSLAGKTGHPTLIATKYRDEILAGHDDSGLRGLFQAHPEDVFRVEVREILEDMDYPEDYRRMVDGWSQFLPSA